MVLGCMTVGVGLQAFQTAEELEAEDSWFCSKCKRHVQANKKLDLWALPEVLVVHLKRFFFTRARRDKLDVQVNFPVDNWDLSDYLPRHQVRLSCCCVTIFSRTLWLHGLLSFYICHKGLGDFASPCSQERIHVGLLNCAGVSCECRK